MPVCICRGNMIRDDIISLADVDTIAGSPYMLVAELVTDPAAATGKEGGAANVQLSYTRH